MDVTQRLLKDVKDLQFCFNELLGELGWGDEISESGVDPLAWARNEIKNLKIEMTKLRARLGTARAQLEVKVQEKHKEPEMKLEFGNGNINVSTHGDGKGNYGVSFFITPESHKIGSVISGYIGKSVDELMPDVRFDFGNSASVQVVIDALNLVRDDLKKLEVE